MAQKVITNLIDDLDGSNIDDGNGRTVRFSFDGADYEIDLSDSNIDSLRSALSAYVAAGRRVTKGSSRRQSPRRSGGLRSSEDLAAVREWAAANGHELSGRGRIAQAIKDEYYKAAQ
jgi:hypothetical protein